MNNQKGKNETITNIVLIPEGFDMMIMSDKIELINYRQWGTYFSIPPLDKLLLQNKGQVQLANKK